MDHPKTKTRWKDRKNGMTYLVESVDLRGVLLRAELAPGFCRLSLEKFRARFERVGQ